MAVKLFLTGCTGYIGGDALHTIVAAHPDWDLTVQVRNSDKGSKVAAVFPKIKLVYGDLDASDLIEEEACKADIVYHFANCDHVASATAIVKGLARRRTPGYYIHTSGSMILSSEYIEDGPYGELSSKVYNDWDAVGELTSMPDAAAHRNVDKIVLEASTNHSNIKTAIVCPPMIYGVGRGPDNKRSMQVYMTTQLALQRGGGFVIGKGQNKWHQVHVHDLSKLYLLIGEAAAAGGAPATWNDQGYYLAENGDFIWGDICETVTEVAYKKGLLTSKNASTLSTTEAKALHPAIEKMIGTNSRGISIRGKRLLGWEPKEHKIDDEIESIVEDEAKTLGLIKGHAEMVIQDTAK